MRLTLLKLTGICLLAIASAAFAGESTLSQSKQWLSLLHFDRKSLLGPAHSAIVDNGFFLASEGATDPGDELTATLLALRADPAGMAPDEHATCRFPARAAWLSKQIGESWPRADCPRRDAWIDEHKKDTVQLIFASGYLGNPASFFGHLMIQLGQKPEAGNPLSAEQLLNTSINFGADVPTDDGLFIYMMNGLVGGYSAKFSNAPFYRNTAIYSESEMRDLWIYELALPEADRKFILLHIYEILGHDYDYLFLTQNCASRIARTLELVIDTPLSAEGSLWVSPESVLRRVSSATLEGKPILASVRQVPSRQLITQYLYKGLAPSEQLAARRMWPRTDKLDIQTNAYRSLPPRSQSAVIDTLLSHLATLKQGRDASDLAEIERELLAERLSLPTGTRRFPRVPAKAIHEVSPSSVLRIQGVANDATGGRTTALVRPMLYDLLDGADRVPDAQLEIGTAEVALEGSDIELEEFRLFSITNLVSTTVPLPRASDIAWHASVGANRASLDCVSCLGGYATLLAGKSARLGRSVPFLMVGGQARSDHYTKGALAPMTWFGWSTIWGQRQSTLVSATYRDALTGGDGRRFKWTAEHRYAVARNWDFRFKLQQDKAAREFSGGISFYF